MRLLSVLALALMPLNMAANAQAHGTPLQTVTHSDCAMQPQHQPTQPADASLCVIACTALPASSAPLLPPMRRGSGAELEAPPPAVLHGKDLEPVPPPPRSV
jgi:hypothetical protein